jgi:hypothetical protein
MQAVKLKLFDESTGKLVTFAQAQATLPGTAESSLAAADAGALPAS